MIGAGFAALTFVVLGLLPVMAPAGEDRYLQAVYKCDISETDEQGKSLLTVKVRNRSEYITIYGFRVDARYLDCKLPEIKKDKDFIAKACKELSIARFPLGSMAKPPRDDIEIAPGQTRTFSYRFRYPGNPSHKNYRFDLCRTHSTATFTAAEAPAILGLTETEKPKEPPFWKRWLNALREMFE